MICGGNIQIHDLGMGSKVWGIELAAEQEGAARLGEFILFAEEKARGAVTLVLSNLLRRVFLLWA